MAKIEFVPSRETPALKPVDFVLDGVRMGTVEPCVYGRDGEVTWHAALHLPPGQQSGKLIHGHGRNHQDAVLDAIKSAMAENKRDREWIEAFAASVGASSLV